MMRKKWQNEQNEKELAVTEHEGRNASLPLLIFL